MRTGAGTIGECVDALLAALCERRSDVAHVVGPAGSGKSALLAEAASRAGGAARVLRVAGSPGEQDLPFAALYDLIHALRQDLDRLPGRQAAVLRSALAVGPAVEVPDRFTAAVAIRSLLGAVASDTPVLLLVDDADLLDAESASALGFVLRRVKDEAIVVVLTSREDLGDALGICEARRWELAGRAAAPAPADVVELPLVRARRLRAAAEAALTAGHVARALELVAEGLHALEDPVERARLVHLRGRMALWGGPGLADAAAELAQEAERILEAEPLLAGLMLADAGLLRCYAHDVAGAIPLAERAVALTGTDGGVPHAVARTTLGVTLVLANRIPDAVGYLESYSDLLTAEVALAEAAQMLQHVSIALAAVERYDDAVTVATRFIAAARSMSAVGLLAMPLCLLANSAFWAGDWEQAQLAAAEALALAKGTEQPALELYAIAMLALVAGGRGQEERCRSHIARGLELCDLTGLETFRPTILVALALLELGLDRPHAALEPLYALKALFAGEPGRGGLLHWRADFIYALWRAGETAAATAELAAAERDLAMAHSAWERAALTCCRGLLTAAPESALQQLRASVDALAGTQPFEEGRSRLRLAERLLVQGQVAEGRAEAERAAALFGDLRAEGWQAQARALLQGAAAPPVQALQPAVGVRIRLLGQFAVVRDGRPVQLPPSVGVQALKLVALHGGRLDVDHLVERLWPDAGEGRGRARLRNVLNRLRRDGGELLLRDGNDVVLPPGAVVDVVEFERTAEAVARDSAGCAAAAVALYAGELLPGDRYEDWTSAPRERLRGRYLMLLDRLIAEAAGAGDVEQATSWFEQALAVEPHDEERYVAMGRLLLALDRRGQAYRVVMRCSSMLHDLGLPRSRALQELAERLSR